MGSYMICNMVRTTSSCTVLSSNGGIPHGLIFPFAFGIYTRLVTPTLYSPEITLSLNAFNLARVVPSIVILSNEGVLEPAERDSFIYATFHRSSSFIRLNNLSFTK